MPEIIIDKEKCIGCGACGGFAPNVFALGEDGKAEVIDPDGDSSEMVELARKTCPVKAIEVK